MAKPVELGDKLFLIDDFDLKLKQRTGTYVLTEEKLTIIETSASPSIPYILDGLAKLQLTPADIQYIIVTHIHLDHAGGAGLLLEHCPNASVVVHPKGARHLADPSRLIASAQTVYGDKFLELFDPILPIPSHRLIIMNDQDKLEIGPDCTLTFLDSPGHANHHFSIFYPNDHGIFTGDTAGVFYPQLLPEGIELYLPSTSPNQFDPDKMLSSILRFEEMKLERIYFSHFGMSKSPDEVYRQVRMWLDIFMDAANQAYNQNSAYLERVTYTSQILNDKVSRFLTDRNIPQAHPVYEVLHLDLDVCSMGLIDYLEKKHKTK